MDHGLGWNQLPAILFLHYALRNLAMQMQSVVEETDQDIFLNIK